MGQRVAVRPARTGVLLAASVGIMAAASVATHVIGAQASGEAAEQSEHAVVVPTFIGPLGALLLLGAVWLLRRRGMRPVWFLLLPPAAFAIQELAERFLLGPEAEPSLLATVLIQLPFALLAFALARMVLTVVRRVVQILTAATAGSRQPIATSTWSTVRLSIPPRPTPSGIHLGRAPPFLS